MIHPPRLVASGRNRNVLAGLILASALGLLYTGYSPRESRETDQRNRALRAAAMPVVNISYESTPEGGGDPASLHSNQRMASMLQLFMLRQAETRLSQVKGYTAEFTKIERIDGEVTDPQLINLKLRHEPFSVYMNWETGDAGREVIYVEGANDGHMVVHPGGWKARLVSAIELSPTGNMAMSEARHPVTRAGLLNLVRQLIENREKDLAQGISMRCQMAEGLKVGDRTCYCFVTEFFDQDQSPEYRKSILHLDQELLVPISIRNYGWMEHEIEAMPEEIDDLTLLECYTYNNLNITDDLQDEDFSRDNPKYNFKR